MKSVTVNTWNMAFFSSGACINSYSYASFAPVLAALVFFSIAYLLLLLTPLGGKAERRMFIRVFSVGFLMSGVAAVYANQFGDPVQLMSDARGFFVMATTGATDLTLNEIRRAHSGSLAIYFWRAVYNAFSAIGFSKMPYIGILFNVTVVSFSGVFGIKLVRLLVGNDPYRFRNMTLFVSSCGLFWLFAGVHVRDALALLVVTTMTYAWAMYLTKPGLNLRLVYVICVNLAIYPLLQFVRTDFAILPVFMGAIASASLAFMGVGHQKQVVRFIVLPVAIATLVLFMTEVGSQQATRYEIAKEIYSSTSGANSTGSSLASSLILNQPTIVRSVIGTIYLFTFPIPFWFGVLSDTVYQLFKSANVIFFYFLLPVLFVAFGELKRNKETRAPVTVFMFLLPLFASMAVAATSLETRHFGAFLMPVFAFACLPDFRKNKVWRQYKMGATVVFSGVAVVHLAWLAL